MGIKRLKEVIAEKAKTVVDKGAEIFDFVKSKTDTKTYIRSQFPRLVGIHSAYFKWT